LTAAEAKGPGGWAGARNEAAQSTAFVRQAPSPNVLVFHRHKLSFPQNGQGGVIKGRENEHTDFVLVKHKRFEIRRDSLCPAPV